MHTNTHTLARARAHPTGADQLYHIAEVSPEKISKRGKGTNISVDFRELLKEGLITGEEFKYLTSGASDASASTQVHMCR
jgi:hypothetical protein